MLLSALPNRGLLRLCSLGCCNDCWALLGAGAPSVTASERDVECNIVLRLLLDGLRKACLSIRHLTLGIQNVEQRGRTITIAGCRKLKRFLYRQLETVRKGPMPRYLKDNMAALLRRDLRNCYKRINTPVAI